jgi:hypothetical protein
MGAKMKEDVAMKEDDADRRIHDLFSAALSERGFAAKREKGCLKFERERGDARQGISFPFRFEFKTRQVRFDVSLGNRYPALERLFGDDEICSELVPGLGTAIHLLRDDRNLYEWYLEDPAAVLQVMDQIDRYGIPFLDKFADLDAVKRQFESESPLEWFQRTAEERICFLAAIALHAGDNAEALRLVDEALEERKGAPVKKRWKLEELRKRVTSPGPGAAHSERIKGSGAKG